MTSVIDQTADAVNELYDTNYVAMAGAALIIIDHAITLFQEVHLIWHRRWTAATFLFIFNRVLATLTAMSYINISFNIRTISCAVVFWFSYVSDLALLLLWAVVNALRVYAIGGHNASSAAVVLLLSVVPFSTNLYLFATISYSGIANAGDVSVCISTIPLASQAATLCNILARCPYNMAYEPFWFLPVEIFTRASLILADVVTIGTIWLKTRRIQKDSYASGIQAPLITVLLRDGTLYFIALLAINCAQLGTYLATNGYIDLIDLITALTSIIVSRFLLSLREAADVPANGATRSTFIASGLSMRFASAVVRSMAGEVEGSFGFGGLSDDFDSDAPDDQAGGANRKHGPASPEGMLDDLPHEEDIMEVPRTSV